MLIELTIGLFACSLLFLAAARLMRQSLLAEKRIEVSWGTQLAGRTVLELSCVTGVPIDTNFVYLNRTIRAWSTIDSVASGELIVRAHALHTEEGHDAVELARLVWPGTADISRHRREP